MVDDLLRLESVDLDRGARRLLTGVSFQVRPGDCWQMLGSNGSGKTSLMRTIAGLTRLGLQGQRICTDNLLYQGHLPGLKTGLSCRENLRWHASGGVVSNVEKIDAALAHVGLQGYEDRVICQLSAGQQRRVGLARLWLSQAQLWLLDEPFTAIDVRGTALLEAQMQRHCAAGGAVVFTSHQPTGMSEIKILDLNQYAA
jgi:heme exporter protein A